MGLFIMFIIWYNIIGKSNPKIYRSLHNKIGGIFTALIMISIFSSLLPSLGGIAIALFALAMVFSPMILMGWGISKLFSLGRKQNQTQEKWNNYYKESINGSDPYKNSKYNKYNGNVVTAPNLTGLTKSVPKRRKIVEKFNKQHSLNLTDEEITRIVDASYVSFSWEKEIFDMNADRNSIFEWYNSETSWLRAYLKVFPIQSVSSDFKRQHEVCVDIFDQIFTACEPVNYASTAECIEAINNKYYTSFDDTTFMIAYNFLDRNGRRHELPREALIHSQSDLEKLMSKYDDETNSDKQKRRI